MCVLILQAVLSMTQEDEVHLMDCWRSISQDRNILHNVSIMKEYLDLWHLTPFYDPQVILISCLSLKQGLFYFVHVTDYFYKKG